MNPTFDNTLKTTLETLNRITSPLLLQELSWEASPMHWSILECFYLARTVRECEAELKNGANELGFDSLDFALGEGLNESIERFVNLGVMRILTSEQKLSKVVLLRDMHKVAQSMGIEVKATKMAQIKLLLASATADELCSSLCPEAHLTLTDEGKQLFRNRRTLLSGAISKLCELIWVASTNDDLPHALTLIRDLRLMKDYQWLIDESTISDSLHILFYDIGSNFGNDPRKDELILSRLDEECIFTIFHAIDAPNIDDLCLAASLIHLIGIEDSWSLFPLLHLSPELVSNIPCPSLLFDAITEFFSASQEVANESDLPPQKRPAPL